MTTLTHSDIATICHALRLAGNSAAHYARATRAAGPEYELTARKLDADAARYRALHDRIARAAVLAYAYSEE